MKRREFVQAGLIAVTGGVALEQQLVTTRVANAAMAKTKYHLRYAPHLTILSNEKARGTPDFLEIPQRLELIAEHGFDAVEYNRLYTHSFSEIEAIKKKMDSLGLELGIFIANPDGWTDADVVKKEHHPKFLDWFNQIFLLVFSRHLRESHLIRREGLNSLIFELV